MGVAFSEEEAEAENLTKVGSEVFRLLPVLSAVYKNISQGLWGR